jgi:hypothetical protein
VAKVAKVRRQAARQAAGINPRAISGSYDQQIRIVIAKKKPSIQYGKQTQLILGGASANHFNLDSFSSETPPSPRRLFYSQPAAAACGTHFLEPELCSYFVAAVAT